MKQATIPIISIYVIDRARQDFDKAALNDLIKSIKEVGLITPIAVCYTEERYRTSQAYRLLAGERRLRACKELGFDTIPVNIFEGDASRLSVKAIEGAENFQRSDLTPQERVLLMKDIHEEQIKLHGERISSRTEDGWSQKDTAEFLGVSQATVSLDLKTAKALEAVGISTDLNSSELRELLRLTEIDDNRNRLNEELEERAKNSTNMAYSGLSDSLIVKDPKETLLDLPQDTYDMTIVDFRLAPASIDPVELMLSVLYSMKPNSWIITFEPPLCLEYIPNLFVRRFNSKGPSNLHELRTETFYGHYTRRGNPQLGWENAINSFCVVEEDDPIGDKNLYAGLLRAFAYSGCTLLVPFVHTGIELITAAERGVKPTGYTEHLEVRNVFLSLLTKE